MLFVTEQMFAGYDPETGAELFNVPGYGIIDSYKVRELGGTFWSDIKPMKIKYLVTTSIDTLNTRIKSGDYIAMVDGTVPNWSPRWCDLHYDHHRSGGGLVQIDDMPPLGDKLNLLELAALNNEGNWEASAWTVVTTQVDADACVAAAWLQLTSNECSQENQRKLWAIAHDCDHLVVPESHSDLAEFAAKAVAALKTEGFKIADQMGLPKNRQEWSAEQKEAYASEAFKQGTEWLLDAVRGKRPFPGESGEADKYWEGIQSDAQMLIDNVLIYSIDGMCVADLRGITRYLDPRACLEAWKRVLPQSRVQTLTWRTHKNGQGYSYTLGSVPLHPDQASLDYTQGTFEALSRAEKAIDPNAEGWGGRSTVGGSGWNTPSLLEPEQVVQIVLDQ